MDTQQPTSEISHRTAQGLHQLKKIVTVKRFKELTANTPIEELSEPAAFKVYQHLVDLSEYYADFMNITIGALESNQIEAVTNPSATAALIVPRLMDRMSQDSWQHEGH